MPRKVNDKKNRYDDEYYEQGGQHILAFFRNTAIGKSLVLVLGFCLVCIFDLLIASDRIELFYTILGIELLLLIVSMWFVFLLRNR